MMAKDLGALSDAERAKVIKRREYLAGWREANKERLSIYFTQYQEDHPELKEYYADYFQRAGKARRRENSEPYKRSMRKWRKANRPKLNELRRDWVEKNPERARAIELRHQEKRKPQKRISDREYRLAYPEIVNAGIARAKAAKPELYKAISSNSNLARRARQRNSVIEPVSLQRVRERDCDTCHLCLTEVTKAERSFDHLIPVVRNGAHAEWNLMVAHLKCNKSRGATQVLPAETQDDAERYIAAHGFYVRQEVAA